MNQKYFHAGKGLFVKEDGKQLNRLITVPVHSEIQLRDGEGHFRNRKEPTWLNFETNNYGTRTGLSLITNVDKYRIRFKLALNVLNTIIWIHDSIPELTTTRNLLYQPSDDRDILEKIVITDKMYYVMNHGLTKRTPTESSRILKMKKEEFDKFFNGELIEVGDFI